MKNKYSRLSNYSLQRNLLKQLILITLLCVSYISAYSQWTQIGMDLDGAGEEDLFGFSVSFSSDGSILAVGVPGNDRVLVYVFNGTNWAQLGQDIIGEPVGLSGQSVSLSADGSTLAIGVPFTLTNSLMGQVRIYTFNGTEWLQQGQNIDGEGAEDQSGGSVSLSADGSTVAIGAHINSNDNGISSGHVRVYTFNGNIWVQQGQDIDGEAAGDYSGSSVSLSANGFILAVGAPANNVDGNAVGHVRVYSFDGINYIQQGQDIDGEIADFLGTSVSLSSSGSTLAIGGAGGIGAFGHVRIYTYNGASWVQLGQNIVGEAFEDQSGRSVSLSSDGTIVAIGATHNDDNGENSGHVRVYAFVGSNWVQQGQDLDGEAADDNSGWSVSLSADGTSVAIGAFENNGNGYRAGHVRVYGSSPVSVSENSLGYSLSMYPNPTESSLNININNNFSSNKLIIYDLTGQIVLAQNLNVGLQRIDINHLAPSAYFVKFSNENELITKQLIIE